MSGTKSEIIFLEIKKGHWVQVSHIISITEEENLGTVMFRMRDGTALFGDNIIDYYINLIRIAVGNNQCK